MRTSLIPILQALDAGKYGPLSDGELLSRFSTQRDEGAFRELVLRKGPLVYAVCFGQALNRAVAEEAFQETFLELVRRGHAIRQHDKLAGWLRKTARRIAARHARRERRRQAVESMARPAGVGPAHDATAAAIEQAGMVWAEVRRLPHNYRTVLELRYLAGMSPVEIAQQLFVPVATVKTRLQRGLDRLRPALQRLGVGILLAPIAAQAMPPTLVDAVVQNALAHLPAAGSRGLIRVAAFVGLLLLSSATIGVAWLVTRSPSNQTSTSDVVTLPESLQVKNLRILQRDVVPEVVEAVRPVIGDDARATSVRTFDTRATCLVEASNGKRVRCTYCVLSRRLIVDVDLEATGRWQEVNPDRGIVLAQWSNGPGQAKSEIHYRPPSLKKIAAAFERLPGDKRAAGEIGRERFGGRGFVVPAGFRWIAGTEHSLFVVTADGYLLTRNDPHSDWACIGAFPGWAVAATDSRLFCIQGERLLTRKRDAIYDSWTDVGAAPPEAAFSATGDVLYSIRPDGSIWSRPATDEPKSWTNCGTMHAGSAMTASTRGLVWRRMVGQESQIFMRSTASGTDHPLGRLPKLGMLAVWGDRLVWWDQNANHLQVRPIDQIDLPWTALASVQNIP